MSRRRLFKRENRNWVEYRRLPNIKEIDYHPDPVADHMPYWERMEHVYKDGVEALRSAQEEGLQYVLFTHGWSTSRIGKTTARSQIRKLMRSKDATPYILRNECIQHPSVFVAAIKSKS